jgi:hypothetical protein
VKRVSRRVALIVALAAAVAATGWGTSSAQGAGVPDSHAFANPSEHALASTTIKAVVRVYDARGHLLSRRVVHPGDAQLSATPSKDCSLLCHANGCAASSCPDSGGHARIDVIQKGYSTLGADLWSWDVWTKWSWNHRGCPCTVSLIDKGHVGKALDQFWAFDGVVHRNLGYRDGSGGPHTYYHDALTGQFHGPGYLPGYTVYRRPKNVLNSYNDGTFEWWDYCC